MGRSCVLEFLGLLGFFVYFFSRSFFKYEMTEYTNSSGPTWLELIKCHDLVDYDANEISPG